ncbi:MAG: hypothetical protein IKU62_06930 [Ruminiclostridium sp.]|nr:hypothetical protein [Ruminiclostridium sp.]
MGLLIVYAMLFIPVVVLVATWSMSPKWTFPALGLCLVLATLFGWVVGGLSPVDILTLESHGTITLLLVWASWLVTGLCALIRLLTLWWRKGHPIIKEEYIDADYYQEVIDEE